MKKNAGTRLIVIIAAIAVGALAAAWWRQSNIESLGSVTVKVPPAHSIPEPGFR
jgi:hypothetical protein